MGEIVFRRTAVAQIPLRQKVRKALTALMLITFPVYFYYLSPVIPLGGSAEGIISGSLIVFAVLFVSAFVLSRGFCSFVCPAGTIQDLVGGAGTRPFPRRYFNWLKYLVWGIWLAMLFFFFRRAGGVKALDFALGTVNGISVSDTVSLIVYIIVISVFFLMALIFGRRAACHTICWMAPFMVLGSRAGAALRVPSIRIISKPENCISCGKCTSVCPMSLDVRALQQAGAISSTDCILCGNCVDACPKKVLLYGLVRG